MSLLHAHVVQIPVTAHPQKRAVGPGHWYVLRDRRPARRYRRLQRTLCATCAATKAGSVTHVSSCNPSPLDTLTVVPDAPPLGEHDRIRQNKQPLGKSNSSMLRVYRRIPSDPVLDKVPGPNYCWPETGD